MKKAIAYIYLPLIAFYLFMATVYPVDQATMARRDLTPTSARVVSLSIAIPLIFTWLLAFYSAWRFVDYARTIKKSPDGPAMIELAYGVLVLAMYMPVRMVLKSLLNFTAYVYPSLINLTNTTITYVNLIFPLAAFVIISHGARRLTRVSMSRSSLRAVYVLGMAFILLGVTYCYLSFTVKTSIAPTNWLLTSQDAIPMPIRLVTIIIPYLFMWFIGLVALYEIYLYRTIVKGVMYRQSLRLLSLGIMSVLLASIAMQFFTATAAHLQRLPLGIVLLMAYGLVGLLAAAFVTIARGVSQFQRIEESG